jgi:hypothetical protein
VKRCRYCVFSEVTNNGFQMNNWEFGNLWSFYCRISNRYVNKARNNLFRNFQPPVSNIFIFHSSAHCIMYNMQLFIQNPIKASLDRSSSQCRIIIDNIKQVSTYIYASGPNEMSLYVVPPPVEAV